MPTPDGATCTVALAEGGTTTEGLSAKQRQMLEVLDSHFLAEGASLSEWATVCRLPESTFYHGRKQLLLGGYISQLSRKYHLLTKGREALQGSRLRVLTPNSNGAPTDSNGVPPQGGALL